MNTMVRIKQNTRPGSAGKPAPGGGVGEGLGVRVGEPGEVLPVRRTLARANPSLDNAPAPAVEYPQCRDPGGA